MYRSEQLTLVPPVVETEIDPPDIEINNTGINAVVEELTLSGKSLYHKCAPVDVCSNHSQELSMYWC